MGIFTRIFTRGIAATLLTSAFAFTDGCANDAAAMDYTAACAAFKAGHAALARALKFYVLDGHASDHVELLQQQSALYKCVAAFEPDEKKQLAMHSRRVALLAARCHDVGVPEHC